MPVQRLGMLTPMDASRRFERFDRRIPARQARELRTSISAAAPGSNIHYFSAAEGAKGEFVLHSQDETTRWLRRNTTHFLKIVIPRQPADAVFTLKLHA